ncbi:MAG TPA: MFS transporter [Chloroflexota bacterium]|nr:MFS transporter [Chloroflexota bacterium]
MQASSTETVRRSGPGASPAFAISAIGVVLVALTTRQAVSGVPPILADLGLAPTVASVLVAIPVLCFSLGALAGPALRARFGEERALFLMMAALLTGLVLRAVWPSWALFPGTILAGLSIAVINVLLPSLVKRRFPNRIGPMMAAYTMAMAIGASVASGLTALVLREADGAIGVALGVWAIPTAIALVAWLPQLRLHGESGSSASGRTIHVWRQPLAWHVLFYMGMQSLLFYGPLSWLPAIYRDRGVDPAEAGLLLMVFNGFGIVGNFAAPMIASRLPDQRPAVATAIVMYTVGLLGVLLAPTSTALLWAIVLGIAQGANLSLALLVIVLRSSDGDVAAALSGMAQSGGYLIASTGPLVMGLLYTATGGWTVPLLFLLAVAGLIWIPGMMAARSRVITR